MKAVLCLCLVLAIVSAETTEKTEYTDGYVAGTTQATIVDQSTILNNHGNSRSSLNFGSQSAFSGNLFESKSPYSVSKSSTGFSLTHPFVFGKQQSLTSRYQSGAAVPVDASKSNGLFYGYGVSGVNGASLDGKYGLVKDAQYSYPAGASYGFLKNSQYSYPAGVSYGYLKNSQYSYPAGVTYGYLKNSQYSYPAGVSYGSLQNSQYSYPAGVSYGFLKNSQYAYPAAGYGYNYGYNTAVSESQAKIAHVDTQVRVDTTQQKHINTLHTITKQVPVPQPYPVPYQVVKTVAVPQPYPVQVVKSVPVPYQVKVQVPVDKPYPVQVPHQVPVPVHVKVPYPVEKPYPVPVEKTVKVPVERPVYVRVPQPVAVRVPQPYPVKVVKPYPVEVPTPVVVKVPEIINVHKVDYAVAPVQYHGCDHHSHQQFHHEVPVVAQNVPISDAAISESAYGEALASQVNTANFESLNSGYGINGAYQIQPAQLVGVYHEPLYQGSVPSIVDAKYSFKRETAEKKEEKKDGKKL